MENLPRRSLLASWLALSSSDLAGRAALSPDELKRVAFQQHAGRQLSRTSFFGMKITGHSG